MGTSVTPWEDSRPRVLRGALLGRELMHILTHSSLVLEGP